MDCTDLAGLELHFGDIDGREKVLKHRRRKLHVLLVTKVVHHHLRDHMGGAGAQSALLPSATMMPSRRSLPVPVETRRG